ncbi:unnamed protein product [Paramecium sonneborni]|uniref:Uncharacterized protein n=1 Tax=Paramecium sonneborni TaxID=65129 RepID=A0A8S1LCI2_9CILI|nr:unnamed protein product [Paramecium sonneborni]
MQQSNLDEYNEELSPEKPIQEINKYKLTPILLQNTPPRKLQGVHSYYSKQSISPLSNDDEGHFDDFEDLQVMNNINDDHMITGSNTCPNLTDNRNKTLEQVQLSQYMFYYKSNQKISIPRASIFKIQHMTEKKLKQQNKTIKQSENIKE